MAITLGSNIASLRGQRQLTRTSQELGTVFQRLSSGQRINKASDDAAGLSIADSLNARSRIYNQGVRNLSDGLSLLSIADSAIENLSDIMIRLEELAEQAANGVHTNKQRKAMDDEAQALSKEFFRISKTTEFNGQRLLAGEFGAINLQAGVGENAVLSAGVGGAIGTGTFARTGTYYAGNTPVGIKTIDINGDGMSDLVGADQAGLVNVALGIGGGSFAPIASYATSLGTRWVDTGDFNGDGIFDLAAANLSSNSISILIGRGNGTFSTSVSYATAAGSLAYSVVSGDFNEDGRVDLVSSDITTNTLSIFLGRGDGTFGASTSMSTGFIPWQVSTDDFNRDGIADLAVAESGSSAIGVYLGKGNGSFGSRTGYVIGASVTNLTIGDFNGDGIADLVGGAETSNWVGIVLGRGDGTFGALTTFASGNAPRALTSGDFNGDGLLDLAVANYSVATASILLGTGAGSFATPYTYLTGTTSSGIASGDLNQDGVVDLVTADRGNDQFTILIGQTKDGVAPLLPFSLKTLADARQALPVFKQRRDQLAAQRGEIGAFQSRIDVARNVLEVSSENFRAAESRIRDADIADESSRLVRLNILQQAASSVLAQANQQPALALQLLRGGG